MFCFQEFYPINMDSDFYFNGDFYNFIFGFMFTLGNRAFS